MEKHKSRTHLIGEKEHKVASEASYMSRSGNAEGGSPSGARGVRLFRRCFSFFSLSSISKTAKLCENP